MNFLKYSSFALSVDGTDVKIAQFIEAMNILH